MYVTQTQREGRSQDDDREGRLIKRSWGAAATSLRRDPLLRPLSTCWRLQVRSGGRAEVLPRSGPEQKAAAAILSAAPGWSRPRNLEERWVREAGSDPPREGVKHIFCLGSALGGPPLLARISDIGALPPPPLGVGSSEAQRRAAAGNERGDALPLLQKALRDPLPGPPRMLHKAVEPAGRL
ncbi:hypothetical protein NDU88_003916 [Pleurodeles waltl]|uniref:Uncharacterized protein n=1 Tax=Pleurodeles waltl TaxID=8319 RepID=A0AAV7TS03_PLEWA|nr:hypothetical protein NDU88_003916 [Pleurodeles waltl]